MRHPSCTGILITLLGVGMALTNWASLIVLLAGGVIGLLYRVRVEECVHQRAPGQPHVD